MNEDVIGCRETTQAVWSFRSVSCLVASVLRRDSVVVPTETVSPIDMFCLEDRLRTCADVAGCCRPMDKVAWDLRSVSYSITSIFRNR